jgi:hypothetical protein
MSERTMGERLTALEPVTPALRDRYELAKRALLERRLTRIERIMGWLYLPLAVGLVGGVGARLLEADPGLRALLPLLAVSMVSLLSLGGYILYCLLRPSVHRLRDERWVDVISTLGLAAIAAALLGLGQQAGDLGLRLDLTALSLMFFGATGVCVLLTFLRRHNLENKVKLLEVELRLAELTERLEAAPKN